MPSASASIGPNDFQSHRIGPESGKILGFWFPVAGGERCISKRWGFYGQQIGCASIWIQVWRRPIVSGLCLGISLLAL